MATSSFLFSTELVALLLGVLLHFFVLNNRPVRNRLFKILFSGVTCLMVEICLKIFIDIYAQRHNDANVIIIDILCLATWILHITVIWLLLIYIYNMSRKQTSLWLMRALTGGVYLIGLPIGIYLLISDLAFKVGEGKLQPIYMISFIELFGLIITVLFYIRAMFIRKNFPRPLFKYITYFIPLIMFMQYLQVVYGQILFIDFVYMVPYMVLYFLFHNSTYDPVTGAQDHMAMEGYSDRVLSGDAPYMLFYLNARVLNYDEEKKSQNLFEAYWNFCRECEYLNNKISVYRLSKFEIIMLCSITDSKTLKKVKNQIYNLLSDVCEEYKEFLSVVALVIGENDYIHSSSVGRECLQFLSQKYKNVKAGLNWIEVEDDDYSEYVNHTRIKEALLDIDERALLTDERVVCMAQPILNVQSGKYVLAEALMRLELDGEIISPNVFIPIAEQYNVIHTLTKIILNKVCEFLETNADAESIEAISVNCTMPEMEISTTASEFLSIMERHGVNPSRIRLEITESSEGNIQNRKEIVYANLRDLYNAGVRFYLDDYGTGYSNLARLINLNIHTVKFDKSLLYKAMDDKSMENLMDAMIKAFKEKGTRVLVEGVEDENQDTYAKDHGFEYIQGFKYSKPQPLYQLKEFF